ncbi:NADH-quinone oxidoreductase subunit L [Kiloniella antarctica]|uniref:NADH-quinone oxidoreductase subunit L n=1 Tax=Kiloniella antarctica TaxID=1550907 RepID=A0ABW5BRA0_9PROT
MEYFIVFLPLLGAFIAGLFGKAIGDRGAQVITTGLLLVSAVLSFVVFKDVALDGNARISPVFTWINSGDLQLNWALKIDTLTAVMLIVVTVVSSMVHLYSVGYMAEDKSISRFFSYLSLFTFFMLMLVTSDNLVQMFFGWEGVGLASYLLIGFWYDKPSACAAAMKAFLVNRVADIGFALGIMGVFVLFGTVNFAEIFPQAEALSTAQFSFLAFEGHALTIICLLLFIGAMGKSAQLGLHTWLPDAMEGPTPVSALIHAATMVTAGIFMLCRFSPVFEYAPAALEVVTYVGAATAFFAATIGLTQFDIKRVIAYSTCSQLGYMFFAIGVSAYGGAIFHLMTHAFFKALLFLGAGSVIHAMHHEQDMRKMGGIWKMIPATYILMWIGSIALAGLPPFSGYFSKDLILEAAYAAHTTQGTFAFWAGTAAAFMTAFYSWRLIIMTFHGNPRADEHTMQGVHESPKSMMIPLIVLAIGAVFAGWLGYSYFVGHDRVDFWGDAIFVLAGNDSVEAAHHVETWVKVVPLAAAVSGIVLAYVFYMFVPSLPATFVSLIKPIHTFVYRKWMFDELYDFLFVRPALKLGRFLWKSGDGAVIDAYGPDGVTALTRRLAGRASRLQSGYVYHYAFAMLIGVVALITWYIVTNAG